jgi:hypothetical protein
MAGREVVEEGLVQEDDLVTAYGYQTAASQALAQKLFPHLLWHALGTRGVVLASQHDEGRFEVPVTPLGGQVRDQVVEVVKVCSAWVRAWSP